MNHKEASSKEINEYIKHTNDNFKNSLVDKDIITGYVILNTCRRSDICFYMKKPDYLEEFIDEYNKFESP